MKLTPEKKFRSERDSNPWPLAWTRAVLKMLWNPRSQTFWNVWHLCGMMWRHYWHVTILTRDYNFSDQFQMPHTIWVWLLLCRDVVNQLRSKLLKMQPEFMIFKKKFDIGSKNVDTNNFLKTLKRFKFWPQNYRSS